MSETDQTAAAAYEPYKESDDHVPASTDIVDQLDTTGTGGTHRLTDVTPIFKETAAQNVVEASDALKADDPLRAANVILPVDVTERDAAVERLHTKADELRDQGVVSPVEQQAAAFEAGASPAGGDSPISRATTGPGDHGAPFSGSTGRPGVGDTQASGPTEGSEVAGEDKVSKADGALDLSDGEHNTGSDSGLASTSTPVGTPTPSQLAGGVPGSEATSVGTPNASTVNVGSAGSSTSAASTSTSTYDPSKHGVAEVQKYMDEHPDEADAVKKAEYEGVEGGGTPKKRSSIRDHKVASAQ